MENYLQISQNSWKRRNFLSIVKTEKTPFDEENVERAQQKVGHRWVYIVFVLC